MISGFIIFQTEIKIKIRFKRRNDPDEIIKNVGRERLRECLKAHQTRFNLQLLILDEE